MASVIKAGNATDGVQVTSDNTGILELKTGTGAGTTAITIGTDQSVTFAGAVSSSGNQTVTGNLTVDGNTTLGNANTDTILMTAAPSIGGAGLGMGFGFRNRIINGAMVIDQRNAGASVTLSTDTYTLDRWQAFASAASKMSVQRSTTAATGFTNSLLATSLSAYTVGASDVFGLAQGIEGFNTADLGWGASNAQTVTISFWVRSSLTGTFGGLVRNNAGTRAYGFTYTINSANTFEYKTVTIAGDTTGTWATDNTAGIRLIFDLGTGSTFRVAAGSWSAGNFYGVTGVTSLVGTNGATFYITGVQLEKGSTATSFDYRPYGTELQLCQRYYYKTQATGASMFFMAQCGTTTTSIGLLNFPVSMRTAPTALEQSGTAGHYQVAHSNADTVCSSVPTFFSADTWGATSIFTVASGLTVGRGSINRAVNSSAYLGWSAEL